MNGQLLEEVNVTMFTSSKEGRELVTDLTRSAGFSSENIISRLAIARSLQDESNLQNVYESDPRGKQIRGKTLLGKKETALTLLSMLLVKANTLLENEEVKQHVRLHWERGLRLIKDDLKDKELGSLFLEYAKDAALNSEITSGSGLGSPAAKLKEGFIGQQLLKNELLELQEDIIANQDAFAETLAVVGVEGSGKSLIVEQFGNAMGLEVITLDHNDFKNTTTLIEALKTKMQGQGVLFDENKEQINLPRLIISIENVHDFANDALAMVKQLRPMKTAQSLSGGAKIKFNNGLLFITSTDSVEWAKMYALEPYSRSEITQIIKRNVQGGTEEVRKFISLSGRLNPQLSIEKMEEAILYAKNREVPKVLSEAIVFELMDDVWKTNKIGLSNNDIDLLQQLDEGALPDIVIDNKADLHFFIGQRFLNISAGNIEIAYERIKRILEADALKGDDGDN